MRDLTGRKFGMLTIVSINVPKPYVKKSWNCICDCGNTCVRNEASLIASARDGRLSNCGCVTNSYLTPGNSERCRKAGQHRQDSYVNGCNTQMVFREGTIKTNSSGYQGISWSNTAHKWHCYIGYKQYRANLGFFEHIADAVKVRKMAEDAINDDTFEDFYYALRGKHLNETKCYKQE